MSTAEATGTELDQSILAPVARVEAFMGEYLDQCGLAPNLTEAVRYALLGGGKRLRPLLAVHCSLGAGGEVEDCLPAAASVEMIHAFSLIHDDLPALDDDDLRRGRPTLHKAHGEALAILAGDALMSLAFQVIAERIADPGLVGRLVREIGVGTTNMIVGQVYDTVGGFEAGLGEAERLRLIHANKTGALIRVACRMGALCAGAEGQSLEAAGRYGTSVGLMFQIVDDLLDIEQTTEHTGKRTSKDSDAGKVTYPGVLGVEESRREIERLLAGAREAAGRLRGGGAALVRIAEFLAVRTR